MIFAVKHALAVVLLVLIAGVAWPRFQTELTVIGFSLDGKYFAYQSTIPYSAGGYAYSSVYLLDVEANSYAGPRIRRRAEGELTEAQLTELVRAEANAMLRRFGIIPGNTGNRVYAGDVEESREERIASRKRWTVPVAGTSQEMELRLQQREARAEGCEALESYDLKPRVFTLVVDFNARLEVLQNDTILPRSRNCAYAYTVSDVFVYNEFIAVFLDSYSVGFEGDNVRKLAVTGSLP